MAVNNKSILVTGAPRSGTTWVGKMLAQVPSIFYIHEPFSVSDPPSKGICNIDFKYWFTYICSENEMKYYRAIKNTINLKYDWLGALKNIESIREWRLLPREWRLLRRDWRFLREEYHQVLGHHIQHSTLLIKDPIAVFSAAWLAERFKTRVVILIRHPAAFVSSIKKLNWDHPFEDFLKQDLMMKNILYPFQAEIEEFCFQKKSSFEQAILLWKLIYWQILNYRHKNPKNFIFIRHEDLSLDPVQGFKDIFSKLDLDFTEEVRAVIENFSASTNPRDPSAPVGSDATLKRNSKLNIWNWKKRLTYSEINKIRNQVEDISVCFYSNEEW